MRTAALLLALSVLPASAQVRRASAQLSPVQAGVPAVVKPVEKVQIPWDKFSLLEKDLDDRIQKASTTDPMLLLGNTKGVYVSGYGVVFTTALDLIQTPGTSPFKPKFTKEEAAKVRDRKVKGLPVLRETMRGMWLAAASSLVFISANEQIVIAVRVLYFPWEDTRGLPSEVVVKGERAALLTGNIQTEEQ